MTSADVVPGSRCQLTVHQFVGVVLAAAEDHDDANSDSLNTVIQREFAFHSADFVSGAARSFGSGQQSQQYSTQTHDVMAMCHKNQKPKKKKNNHLTGTSLAPAFYASPASLKMHPSERAAQNSKTPNIQIHETKNRSASIPRAPDAFCGLKSE